MVTVSYEGVLEFMPKVCWTLAAAKVDGSVPFIHFVYG